MPHVHTSRNTDKVADQFWVEVVLLKSTKNAVDLLIVLARIEVLTDRNPSIAAWQKWEDTKTDNSELPKPQWLTKKIVCKAWKVV